ncbi:MAG TPA: NUDIX hydrolase [Roseiflexaceae bacterium]|nr:NUDIX hydrolase [Roseiflexaceae bacterium]
MFPSVDDYPARLQYRYCPLCAAPLERALRDDQERLVCPRDGWVHYPTPNLAATVVVEHAGGIVLLRRAIEPDVGIWHLPIGHIEFGEPPAEAARREADEETGLVLDEPAFLDFEHSRSYGDPRMFYIVFCYRARAVGGVLRANAENSEARVCAPDALPELKWTSQRRALAAWRAWKAGETWIPGRPTNDQRPTTNDER